jgi:hypothetical protein
MASKIKVDQIQTADGTGTIALQNQLSGVTYSSLPVGSVVQVTEGSYSDYASISSETSYVDTGLSGTITPKYSNSKILITVSFGRIGTTASGGDLGCSIKLLRNNTDSDLNGLAAGSRPRGLFNAGGLSHNTSHSIGGQGMTGFDSPNTTSQVTYKCQVKVQDSNYPCQINGGGASDGNQYSARTKAFIVMMEIKQ